MNYEENKHIFIDSGGKKLVLSLFKETNRCDVLAEPHFSLKDWKKVYLEIADPTEYETAMALVGDWTHWCLIRNNPTLAKNYFDSWALEVEVKLRSQGIMKLCEHAKGKNMLASKWLADGEFVQRDKRTKEGKLTQKKVDKELSDKVKADMERLGISVVGGKGNE